MHPIAHEMLGSDTKLRGIKPLGGYSTGKSVEFVESTAILGQSVKRACKRPKWCRLLYTLVEEFKPGICLELGSFVGISTSYIASAQSAYDGILITLEGSNDFASVAKSNLKSLRLDKNVSVVSGLFFETLPGVLDELVALDFVFIDGHHDGDATLKYTELIKPKLAPTSIVVFDDIRWSEDMLRAWNVICEDSLFNIKVDMEELGICIKSPENNSEKFHYSV